MAFLPILAAAGAAYQGVQQKSAADYNAKVMQVEGRVSGMQANEAANTAFRVGNAALGKSTTAAVESGGGVGGSTASVLNQSATNAELDALNTRYAGILKKTSYDEQSGIDTAEGKQAEASAFIGGAGSVLKQKYGASMGTYSADGFS